jgi:hypothetical protein
VVVAIGHPKTLANTVQNAPESPRKEENVKEIVREASKRYGVNFEEIWAVVLCETAGTASTTIQSTHMQPYGRERSFGIAQIHLPSHPYITHEQAIDPYFSADFLAKNWKLHRGWWSCAKYL